VLGTHKVTNGAAYTLTVSATVGPTGPVWENLPITPGMNLHQNPVDRFDVNGDGHVTPADAMIVINSIMQQGQVTLPTITTWPAICVDVTGDGTLDLLDAISLLNKIFAEWA
jgi:hypothetical protein